MEKRLIRKDSLAAAVARMAAEAAVLAPVREEGNVLFAPLEGRPPELSFANTRNAPKNALFPHTETLVRYLRTPRGWEFVAADCEAGKAVLFVRPCDARSFLFLDQVFDQDKYRDPYYVSRRERSTVVAVSCARPAYAACFCTSVGGEPVPGSDAEGIDLLLTEVGDDYLAEFLTPKGDALLACFEGARPADEAADRRKDGVREAAREAVVSKVPARAVKPVLDAQFDHPFWGTLPSSCLACGTCTYLCPTCHCFDIGDETTGDDGERVRNWDSCMFPLFTLETSGHNPRPSQKERWRQRVMHKFRYIPENFGVVGCVGCGRCVLNCPVNLDIRKIVQDLSKL